MPMARKNPVHRDTEWECNKKRMKMARKDAVYRDLEKKKKMARKDATYRDLVKVFRSCQVWLVGEVGNHVAIYESKVAEGFSAFQRRSCFYGAVSVKDIVLYLLRYKTKVFVLCLDINLLRPSDVYMRQ